MSKVDKTLKTWLTNTPTEVPKDKVIAIIKRFFPGRYRQEGGSHIVIQDDRLIGIHGYGPEGDFDIPIKGGQKVKGWYLKCQGELNFYPLWELKIYPLPSVLIGF